MLVIVVTENSIMDGLDFIVEIMRQLKEKGRVVDDAEVVREISLLSSRELYVIIERIDTRGVE